MGLRGLLTLAFALFLVEAGEVVLAEYVAERGSLLGLLLALGDERQRLLALLVELDHLEGAGGADGHEVGGKLAVGGVSDLSLEDVGLEVVVCGVGGLEGDVLGGHLLDGLHVGCHLEVEAALELGALAGELLGVEGDVLVAGGGCGHGDECGHPRRAAQRATAGANAADAACLLARAYLLHLDAHLEGVGQHLDELAEVYALVGYIVEDSLLAVALILHVADFHLEL